jgi:hypothetical protein
MKTARATLYPSIFQQPVSVVNVFPPGKYKDFYTGRATRIRADSAAIEAIEATITLFYMEGGRWKSLLISD